MIYPYRARIIAANAYGLPVGKIFLCARIKDGDGSPYRIDVFSYAGDYRYYQLSTSEVALLPPEDHEACENSARPTSSITLLNLVSL
jgi:hypothetical protein